MTPVYITRLSKFFPNEPVSNDEMEGVLGMVADKPSRARNVVLRSNGIKTRYYAFRNGKRTHSNTEMATLAIKELFDKDHSIDDLDLLVAGTSSPEQLLPSHAAIIHGELGIHNLEIISVSGACASSIQAMKYAFMAVGSGLSNSAVAVGSERTSAMINASRFQGEADSWEEMDTNPFIAFEKDFLRWMLSDGAGAALLESKPNADSLSLRVEWIDITSYANDLETCMYAGAVKNEDSSLTGFGDLNYHEWERESVFAFKQDTRLLGENIVPRGGMFLEKLMKKYDLKTEDVDYYLPHMSSEFFKKQIFEYHAEIGMDIPYEKWFYNLPKVGNIGSASAYVMLEELFHSGRLKVGDRLLVMVPESARFTYAYMYLTVV
ncbi:MAG: beta-ketoacyl-ACP synthase III [Chitinophagaceae bacterium]